MPTDRNKDSSFTLLSNVTLVYQWEDLSQTHWPVLKVVWTCVREGWEKCWSMTWVSRRQLSLLWWLGSSCSSLEETRWAVLSAVIDVPKNTRNIPPKQEFIRRRHVHKGGAFQGNVLPKLTLQSHADLTVPLSAEQVKPCSRHRDSSYSVDIKPECKNFTCVAVLCKRLQARLWIIQQHRDFIPQATIPLFPTTQDLHSNAEFPTFYQTNAATAIMQGKSISWN